MNSGSVRIGDLVLKRLRMLEASCPRCGRHGRLSVARLKRDYGADYALPDLACRLSEGCRQPPAFLGAQCPVRFPELARNTRRPAGYSEPR